MRRLIAELELLEKFRAENQPVEILYLKIRTLIRDLTAALRASPENRELQEQLEKLQAEAQALEAQAPWLVADFPVELTFWSGGPGVL